MNYLTLTSTLAAIIYLVIVQITFGKQQRSISATWYYFKKKNYSAAFVWFCSAVGLPHLLQYRYMETNEAALLLALSGFTVFCIGVAANYKDIGITFWHNFFTVVAIVMAMAAIWYEYHQSVYYALGLFALLTLLIYLFRINNRTTWIELSALLTINGFFMYTR